MAVRQARREGRCGYIGRAPQRTGGPRARALDALILIIRAAESRPWATRKGRALFARGFVAGLASITRYALRPAPVRDAKIAPAQAVQSGYNPLSLGSGRTRFM